MRASLINRASPINRAHVGWLHLLVAVSLAVVFCLPMATAGEEPPVAPPLPPPGPVPDANPEDPKPGDAQPVVPEPEDPKAGDAKPKDDWKNPGTPLGADRETMWLAPTARDWKQPCLMTWQRTWDDALAVSQATQRPILICINMDGEIASEHYAGVRYRQAAVAQVYEPYVLVIASVYRHTPRDYDDQGNRIPCPRFGGVTCGEHIKLEAIVYEKYLDGERVAPRHIAVDLDGKEMYDVYYANDTASVFDKVRDTVKQYPQSAPQVVRGDRAITERVGSRDVRDRRAVEQAYRDGDAAMRKALLAAAGKHKDATQLELVRLALFGLDADQAQQARAQLAQDESAEATELISEALQTPTDDKERDALIGALKRLGQDSKLARWLASVHKGLSAKSGAVDVAKWKAALDKPAYRGVTRDVEGIEAEIAKRAKDPTGDPNAPERHLDLAEAALTLGVEAPTKYAFKPRKSRMVKRHMLGYARSAARTAQELGSSSWRVDAVLALAAYYQGDKQAAYPLAETAVKALPAGDVSWTSAALLKIYGEAKWQAIRTRVRAKQDWPPQWLADLDAAYSILRKHDLGTAGEVVWHYELLLWLRARHRASRVLRDGIGRFRDSVELHKLFREQLMRDRGPKLLEAAYERLLKKHDDPARIAAYAGYASVHAARQYRRTMRYPQAVASYGRAIAYNEQAVAADARNKASTDAAIAIALAGRARVFLQLENYAKALPDMLASLSRDPRAAGTRDLMGITPGETAQMLRSRLTVAGDEAGAAQLDVALAKIDPALLRPDVGLMPGR